MTTLEASRRAARPLRRHIEPPRGLSLWCLRCDRPFSSPVLLRECFNCNRAAERVYGSAHPSMEMGGA